MLLSAVFLFYPTTANLNDVTQTICTDLPLHPLFHKLMLDCPLNFFFFFFLCNHFELWYQRDIRILTLQSLVLRSPPRACMRRFSDYVGLHQAVSELYSSAPCFEKVCG